MRIPHSAIPRLRLATVVAFVVACAVFFCYLWVNMGGTLPGISKNGYRVAFSSADADNLVYDSDVMVAGVRVGKVRELTTEDGLAKVVVQLDEDAVQPLHEGVKVHLRSKSLIEETYVELVDGDGAPLPDGAILPDEAVVPSVQLDDVLASLDAPTRKDLSASVRSLGRATGQTSKALDQTMTGLGILGREGADVLDALAAQNADLEALVRESSTTLEALDAGEGRIVDLVEQAERLTSATAGNRAQVEDTLRQLPGVLATATEATASLTDLSADLRPIARDVAVAAPSLNQALVELPATTRDLRGLLPSLDDTLDRAPRTLDLVPDVARDVRAMVPATRSVLADVNPVLAYVEPYGPDLAAFMSNWMAMLQDRDVNGHYLRIFPVLNEQSAKNSPIPFNVGLLDKSNAYPAPGESRNPGPFEGRYPHVERDPE